MCHSNYTRSYGKRITRARPAWATEQFVSLGNLVRPYSKRMWLNGRVFAFSVKQGNGVTPPHTHTHRRERGHGLFKHRVPFLQPMKRREVLKRLFD